MATDALIFDLDGTIWDSAIWFATALGGDDAGIVATTRADLVAGGNIVGILRRAGVARGRLLSEATRRGGAPPLFAGMRDVIVALAERGTRLGVASSLPGSIAEPMLGSTGLTEMFDVVVHAGLCRTAKPHPRSLLMAAEMLGVDPGPKIFYVGDRSVDANAARRAGMSFAWMSHGYEQPAPDFASLVAEPNDLLQL